MMMSIHGNAFHVTLLSAKSTGHWIPVKRDRIAQFSCFRWCWPQWAVEQTVEFLQIISHKICQLICILVTSPVFSGFNQCYYPFPQNRFTGTGAIIYLLKIKQHWIKWWIGVVSQPMLNLSILAPRSFNDFILHMRVFFNTRLWAMTMILNVHLNLTLSTIGKVSFIIFISWLKPFTPKNAS